MEIIEIKIDRAGATAENKLKNLRGLLNHA